MHWLSVVFFVATLQLQHVKVLPAALKGPKPAPITDFADILKFDFSPNGLKKELNFDTGLFAMRSRQELKFGAEPNSEEFVRKKRAVNNVPTAAPCYAMGGGGGSDVVDYDDIAQRRRAQKKSKVSTRAKTTLNKYKKKKKLVSVDEETQSRRRRDVHDITDKAGDFMEKARTSFIDIFNKMRKFSTDLVDRMKN